MIIKKKAKDKMRKYIRIYQRYGINLMIKQWLKIGILCDVFCISLFIGFSKKGLEILRLAIQYKTQLKLRKKYEFVLEESKSKNYDKLLKKHSNKIWISWLQGMDSAPLLVQRCYSSIKSCFSDREIIVITSDNLKEYVEFPDYIIDKWQKGIITNTHFSDLLRVELLINHGGIWIDSTVLCTGNVIPEYMLDSDLFFYQMLKPGRDGHAIGLSSWFISTTTNNKILLVVRDLLYEYWRRNNFLVDYFLLHSFMEIVLSYYPEEYQKVVKVSNSSPHILLLDFFKPFDFKQFEYIKQQTCLHKLSYKLPSEDIKRENTYFDVIINKGKYV